MNAIIEEAVEDIKSDMDSFNASMILRDHIKNLAKARLLTVTGDKSHLSIESLIKSYADIDKPRDYDFQSEDHYEESFLRFLNGFGFPDLFSIHLSGEKTIAAIQGEEPQTLSLGYEGRCYDCGEKLQVTICGTNIDYSAKTGECKSNRVFDVEIDFPTGEVVFGDWPDRFSEVAAAGMLPTKSYDVNRLVGCRQTTDGYVPYQVFHHSVGNTCPPWFYDPETQQIQIGGGAYDEDEDEYTAPNGFVKQGYFCTDLWWVTMLDKKFYDAMIARLTGDRDPDYYEKEVETATIAPGRYRFTAHARTSDDRNIYATAVRIGECSGKEPLLDNMVGRRFLSPLEYVRHSVFQTWNILITEKEANHRLFNDIDNIFNCIGNGIRNKGEFFSHISVAADGEIPAIAPPGSEKNKQTYPRPAPYPNFQENYSLLYEMDIKDIPTDWLEAALWFYQESEQYFLHGDTSGYSYAYPSSRKDSEAGYEERFSSYRKEGMTEEEWHAAISKAYECSYDGDLPDFLTRRWAKEKDRILAFITKTIDMLKTELDKRN
jgi:hypothetical protein